MGKSWIEHPVFGTIEVDEDGALDDDKANPHVISENSHESEDKGSEPIQSNPKSSIEVIKDLMNQKGKLTAQEQGILNLFGFFPRVEGEEYKRILNEMGPEWKDLEAQYNRVAEEGGISVTLDAMKQHKTSSTIQETGCHILRLLSRTNANEEKISTAKGIEVILSAFKLHKDREGVMIAVFRALWNFIFSDDHKIRIRAAGGIQSTLEAMRQHRDSAELQESALKVLWKLSYNRENRVLIRSCSGVNAALTAMRTNPPPGGSAELYKSAAGLLAKICTVDDARAEVVDGGGFELILSAMAAFKTDAPMQQYGCEALAELGVHVGAEARIRSAGGMANILAAMRTHGNDLEVIEYALWALSLLTCCERLREEAVAGGCDELVVAAMQMFTESTEVMESACWCIANLASDLATRRRLRAGGRAAPLALAAVSRHPELAEAAGWVRAILSTNADYQQAGAAGK